MEATTKKVSVYDAFIIGAKKGIDIVIYTMLPCCVLCYTLVHIINLIGLTDFLARVLDPVMGIFGLPGEGIISLIAGFSGKQNGCAVAASLFAEGALNVKQVTILLATNFVWGGMMPQWPRTIVASGTESNMHGIILALLPIGGIFCMLLCNMIL